MSLTKVEYMVASQATLQAMWLSSLFESIDVTQMKPIIIYDDNQGCRSLLKNPIFHVHKKHIKIHYPLMQKKTEKNFVNLVYYNMNIIIVI
jgi:hypothetical protein